MKNDLLKIDTSLPFLTCSNALSHGLGNPTKHKCEFNRGNISILITRFLSYFLNKALYKFLIIR